MKYKYIVRRYEYVKGVIDLPDELHRAEIDDAILAHVDVDTPEGLSVEVVNWSANVEADKQAARLAELVCPECASRVMDNGYCMMGHWCGKPLR